MFRTPTSVRRRRRLQCYCDGRPAKFYNHPRARYHSRRRFIYYCRRDALFISVVYPYPRGTVPAAMSDTRGDGPATSENELLLKRRKQTASVSFLFRGSTGGRTPDGPIVFTVISYYIILSLSRMVLRARGNRPCTAAVVVV